MTSGHSPKNAAPEATPEARVAGSLPAAALLAFAGGALDAFLYLVHGKVFAGAMTGNAVLCGIAILGRNGPDMLHHALPLAAFLCGVWIAEVLQTRLKHHAVTAGLALETAGLLGASFLPPSFPDAVFVFLIALLAAFQIASFRTADSYSYNSTFITGDLRTMVVGLYRAASAATRADGLRQFRDLGAVIVCFLAGALVAAALARPHGNHTLWLPTVAVGTVFLVALRRSLEHAHRTQAPAK